MTHKSLPRISALVSLFSAVFCFTPRLAAQVHSGPTGFQKLTPEAAAESLKTIQHLNQVIKDKPDSAAAWYRRGMIAWALAARDNIPPPIRGLDWTLLGHMADTSLRRAAQMAPGHIEYQLAAGRYLASSFGGLNRTAASVQYGQAVKRARTIDDPALHGAAALEAGLLYFRFYDNFEHVSVAGDDPAVQAYNRRGTEDIAPPTIEEVSALINRTMNARDFPGEYYYLRAEALFNESAKADPGSPTLFRARVMLYASRNRWSEVTATARGRLRVAPADPWGWLALGLGTHRQGDPVVPAMAFDSALAHFDDATAHRLDHIERVIRPADSAIFARLRESGRAETVRLYWLMADPMWSVLGNEPRTEFLARVAYSEFRWTSVATNEIGADTDRGNTFIRYGPPASILSLVLSPSGELESIWNYSWASPISLRGFDRLRYYEPDFIKQLLADTPVRWDNIRSMTVDTMPVQIARFRATADSVDVYIAQTSPGTKIRSTSEVIGPPLASFWIMRGGTLMVAHDSARIPESGIVSFTNRISTGNYVYRVEASAVASKFGARSTGIVVTGVDTATGFQPTGFGMSDVLVSRRNDPRVTTPQRWTDYGVLPLGGTVERNSEISLLWENYELGVDGGAARYAVTITIERERSQAGLIAAGIIRGIAGAVGVNQLPDRTEFSFERTVPHSLTIVDNIALSLGDTPAGRYKLTVKITDHASNRTASWTRPLVVEEN